MTDPQVIVNLGTGGSDLNGQNGSTTSADSNDAKFLDWPGDNAGNYVYVPGDDNAMSVPDEAALDITGDIDVRAYVALDDWSPSSNNVLVGKYTTSGNERSWFFRVSTDGTLRFLWTTDGTAGTVVGPSSSEAVSAADGDALWVRATLDVDNGSSQHEVKFYTSDDGESWTQLGTTQTLSGTTSIYSGSSPVEFGAQGNGSNGTVGKCYRAQVLDGIGGTTVLDIDTSVITSGSATSFIAVTGQTVTINRDTSGRKSVAVVSPVWLFGTDDYMEVADNALLDAAAGQDFSIVTVTRRWRTLTLNAIAAKRNDDSGASDVGYQVDHSYSGSPPTRVPRYRVISSDGTNQLLDAEDTNVAIGDLEMISVVRDAGSEVRYYMQDAVANTDTDTTGDLSNSFPFTIGRLNDGTRDADMELLSVAFFRRALSTAEIAQLFAYYDARWS